MQKHPPPYSVMHTTGISISNKPIYSIQFRMHVRPPHSEGRGDGRTVHLLCGCWSRSRRRKPQKVVLVSLYAPNDVPIEMSDLGFALRIVPN